jgi:hypothetical protein
MKKVLLVIDMQNDFVTGALKNPDAEAIVDGIVKRIAQSGDCAGFDGGLDQPGEPIFWNGRLVLSCFDLVTDETKVNTEHELPATMAELILD